MTEMSPISLGRFPEGRDRIIPAAPFRSPQEPIGNAMSHTASSGPAASQSAK